MMSGGIWREAVVAYLYALFRYLPVGSEENVRKTGMRVCKRC
jgi:hypothetical protein